ncbi:ABC transporter permease [Microbacterium oleivorans]|uniref:Glycine/betaine ABC transporter permease protein n=1 Tax=Microbacterium oleivorans TaxID=273677 RepID=A0A031FVF5_9MICO|nr:proline/glycine betaine ABC transporter permease [Microbacterium oleivorans]EZP27605.1 Glycine/betaine ABC transporter permease protein [Microbacterium oleivorans]THE07957.1 proline/glycine betaine ABC transporter permease [Microbacterium oleivorans]
MDGFRIPIGEWAEAGVAWIRDTLGWLLSGVSAVVGWFVDTLANGLLSLPIVAVIVIFAALAWLLRSWRFAIGTIVGFVLILGVGQWVNSMQTLALVLVAALIAVVIAVPLGIAAARNDTFSAILRPVLDLMQSMPAFVYLIPAIVFFSIGVVPGVVATVIFALPPGVRLTELGIRGVDSETVEAGHAFGATPAQILRGVQLPLAMPSIMAGVNQLIMLALSMAVIAGIAGADGLGKEIVQAMSTVDIAKGVEAGLSVVILAVYLDRLTGALGALKTQRGSLLGAIARRRGPQDARSTAAAAPAPAEQDAPVAERTPARV